jgi:hypothetical protein
MGPHNRCDGNHPDAVIKDLRVLLDNTQDATHHVLIYSDPQAVINHQSRNKMYILDEQLHQIELCIFYGMKVQVGGIDGERISQMCRCTGSQRWCSGNQRNDWLWVK